MSSRSVAMRRVFAVAPDVLRSENDDRMSYVSHRTEVRPFRSAALVAVLVLVHAVPAGQFLTGEGGRGTHGLIGEALGLVALAVAATGYWLRVVDRERWWLGVALLVVAQTGLGSAGRESTTAATRYVPLGVATFDAARVAALPTLR